MFPRIAFVDIETTGLGHARQRIAEIGVVTLDGNGVSEWTTLLDPGRRVATDEEFGSDAAFSSHPSGTGLPRFADIARDLAARLEDRLFVAHNARFDYAFVQAELRRAGIEFAAPALCTVMLSRKLQPQHDTHHLDALIDRHGLDRVERHRALPDARALHQLWQVLHRDTPKRKLEKAIGELLAGPLLPEHLDRGLIDALPERPGVFVLEDRDGRALHIGRASNLRRQVSAYFHVERQCARADDYSHRVGAIRAEPADGPLDARLLEIARRRTRSLPTAAGRRSMVSIRVDPLAAIVTEPVWLTDCDPDSDSLFGLYATDRKARNALGKIAAKRGICLRLVGLAGACMCLRCGGGADRVEDACVGAAGAATSPACGGVAGPATTPACGGVAGPATTPACDPSRKQHLVRLFTALAPLKLPTWPYRGPIAVREGRKVHVFDRWAHLGSVRAGVDVARLLEQRRATPFDADVYVALIRTLRRLDPRSIRVLDRKPRVAAADCEETFA